MVVYIIRTPSEGLMGLDRDGNPIILHNMDMVSEQTLHEDYLKLLKENMMVMPIKMNDNITKTRHVETKAQKNAKKLERKRKNKKCQYRITNWVSVDRKLQFREV